MSQTDLRGDLEEAIRMLAADNARLCEIAMTADKLAGAVDAYRARGTAHNADAMIAALDAFKIARNGS